MNRSTSRIASTIMGLCSVIYGSAQGVDMVLERGFLSDVTIPIGDLSQRSLEYPRMHLSQAQDLDFSARVANLGTDTATNVLVTVEIEQDGISQGTFVSDTIPYWAPAHVDTVVFNADWDAMGTWDVDLFFQVASSEPDLNSLNNSDAATMELSFERMSRAQGAFTGALDYAYDDYTFAMARFEILQEDVTCGVGCVIPYSEAAVGAYIQAVLLDADLNELIWSSEWEVTTSDLSEPGEEVIAVVWFDGYFALQPGHDYYAGIALFGGPDTLSIATQGSASDSSAMIWNSLAWNYINELPMISLIMGGGNCPEAVPEMSGTLDAIDNSPDPSTSTTTISYTLNTAAQVFITLHDLRGEQVMLMEEGNKGAGKHFTMLDVLALPAGMYSYTLTAGQERVSRRMMVLH